MVGAGGLHIVGTERHESRRVDNQLRGRSGRQGDPGSSRFYLSLEDPLLRIFASDRVAAIMDRLKMPEGEAIEHPWVTRAIENAQRKVEARNFDIRKQLLEYDDVANDQRKVIYQQRNELLEATDISETIRSMREGTVECVDHRSIFRRKASKSSGTFPVSRGRLQANSALELPIQQWLKQDESARRGEPARAHRRGRQQASTRTNSATWMRERVHAFERAIMLERPGQPLARAPAALDHLRQGIHLRGYAQKNPKQEYKREAFELFSLMLETVRTEVTRILMIVTDQDRGRGAGVVEKQEQVGAEERAVPACRLR